MSKDSTDDMVQALAELVKTIEVDGARYSNVHTYAPDVSDWQPKELEWTISLASQVDPTKPTFIDVNHAVTCKLYLWRVAEGGEVGSRIRNAYKWFDEFIMTLTDASNVGLGGNVTNNMVGIIPNPNGEQVVHVDRTGWLVMCVTMQALQQRTRRRS